MAAVVVMLKTITRHHRFTITVESSYCQKWIVEILTKVLSRWGWRVHATGNVISGTMVK